MTIFLKIPFKRMLLLGCCLTMCMIQGFSQIGILGPIKVKAGSSYCYQASNSCSTTGFCWAISGAGNSIDNTNCGGPPPVELATKSTDSVSPNYLPPPGGCSGPAGVTINFYNYTTLTTVSLTVQDNCNPQKTMSITVVPALHSVSAGPSSQTIYCGGSVSTLSCSSPSGGDGTYQYHWQSSTDNTNWTDITGATSSTYTPPGTSGTMYYRASVSSFTYTQYSNSCSVAAGTSPLSGGSISNTAQTINYGTTPATLNCSAASGGSCSSVTYSYQWQSSPNNSTWSSISTATGQNYTPDALNATTYYRRKTSISGGATAYSNTAKVTVYPLLQPGSISPTSKTINYNTSPGQLTGTAASGGNGTYTYQWQSSPNNSTWSNVSTATGLNYTPGNLTVKTYYRRRVYSNGVYKYSNVSTITVYPQLIAGSISPASKTINYNTSPGQLTGTVASGGNGTYGYQWQSSPNNSTWSSITSATGQNYTPGNLTTKTYFRRRVSSNGVLAYSNVSAISVYTQLHSGTLSPTSQTLNYGEEAMTITGTAPSGGNGTYGYRWQSSPNNSTWSNISGATAASYTPNGLTATTYYRRGVTSNSVTAYSVSVAVVLPVGGGLIRASASSVSSGGSITLSSVQGASSGSCTSYTYHYQSSTDEQSWTDISSATVTGLTQTSYFRREAVCGSQTAYSNTVRVRVAPAASSTIMPDNSTAPAAGTVTSVTMPSYGTVDPGNMNYIKTREFMSPGMNTLAEANSQTSNVVVHQNTTYYDGLGRPIQSVSKQSTPSNHDLIATTFYDDFGRIAQQYLPYADNGNSGGFRSDAGTKQPAFYDAQFNNTEGYYYSNTQYEASPLNRVLKTTAPGKSWTGHGVGVSQLDRTNELYDSVRIWTIAAAAGSLPVTSQKYFPGSLYIHETTDERDNKILEYKDKEGLLILKKTQITDALQPGHAGWLCTYYVYDDLDNLRFVLQPRAVEYLESHNWVLSQSIADEFCFRYEYDGRKRMIMKKVPGAAEVDMVYDLRDRLVFSQDGNRRDADEWLITYYDALNRPVETGIYTSSTATRTSLQTLMDGTTGTTSAVTYSIPAPSELDVNERSGNTPVTYTARSSIVFLPGFTSGASDNFTTNIDPNAVESSGTVLPADATNPVPPVAQSAVSPLTFTYYDDYSWSGHQAFQSSYLSRTTTAGNPYAESPSTYSGRTKGLVTGTKVKVLGTSTEIWLTTTSYYDDKSRVLQTISSNMTGGTEVITHKYDFSGKLLSTYVVNHNNQSAVTPETRVLTENLYDAGGRLTTISKTVNDVAGSKKVIVTNQYNELGQLVRKSLGRTPSNPLDTLHYDYNIQGWLNGVNKPYVNNVSSLSPAPGRYFGMELDYDYGFAQDQYNGNIAGEKWRTSGDGERRAYGFNYDAANRLTKGDFTQYTSGTWNTSAGVDYTVSGLTYDANGNLKSMKQKGLIGTSSGTVDSMAYHYFNSENSNRLWYVNDPNGTTAALGDFKDGHTGSGDYDYDDNGNLKEDLNKGIGSITYNYLNLPETVDFGSKGNIRFVYDAAGNKLQKIVTDKTQTPNIETTTNYVDGFIYQHIGSTAYDTLQFFPTEEGRIRYVPAHGTTAAGYAYDYFLKDHLGNTRVVLTEQTDFSQYLATMEQPNAQTEDALFYNLDNTREAKPADYPQDNTTTPNEAVAKLNGRDPNKRIGPSIILKVMAGDTIQAVVRAFYRQQATKQNNAGLPAEQMLTGLAQALVTPATQASAMHDMRLTSPEQITSPGLTANDLQNLKQKDPDKLKNDKPKAYLNYVFFDKQFKFVADGSGVKQVDGEPNQLETLSSGKVVAKKNGYVYVYTSNESQQDVLFDNLGVEQITGPVLEETHYYPFGLTMSGISTTAPLRLEGKRKFNGIEFNHKEFSDGSGLDLYTAKFRGLDPQIGRWWQIDPKPTYDISPYSAMQDDPIRYADPLGDTLGIQFRTGFLGLGGKRNVIYNNGNLTNNDGTAYGGKVKGFLKRSVKALNKINGTTDGGKVVSTLQSSTNTFIVKTAGQNPNHPGQSEFIETDRNKSYAVAMTAAGQGKPVLGGSGGSIYWNSAGTPLSVVGGTGVSPITDLAHEMFHGYESNFGMLTNDDPQGTGLARSEYRAAYFENQIRSQLNPPQPLRTGYGFRDASGNPQVAKLLNASGNPIYVPPTPIPPSLQYLNINLIY